MSTDRDTQLPGKAKRTVAYALGLLLTALLSADATTGSAIAQSDPLPHPQYPAAVKELTFSSSGDRMPGFIYIANGPGPHPTVLLLHGFPGNEKNLDIAQAARREGFNVVFFNYRGAWGAEGSYSILTLEEDVHSVLNFFREPANSKMYRVDTAHMTLLGHSLGGYTALAAGRADPELVCVAAMSPVNLALWKASISADDATAKRLLPYADQLFMLADFGAEAMRKQLSAAVVEEIDTSGFGPELVGRSVLLLVGEQDTVTPASSMFDPVVAAYSQVDKLRLEHHRVSGDHSYSWSRLALTGIVLDWLKRDCR